LSHLDQTEEEKLQRIKSLDRIINTVGFHLRYIERGAVRNTPWSMIQCLEDFFRTATGVPSRFLVRPIWSYNYQIVPNFTNAYREFIKGEADDVKEVDSLFGKFREEVFIVSFPRLERLNTTLHCLLGHEMGHTLSKEWLDQNKDDQDELRKRKPVNPVDAWTIFQCGLDELVADLVGSHLLGLGAVFASYEWAIKRNLDSAPSAPDYHPPWRFRIRNMLDSLAEDVDFLRQEKLSFAFPQDAAKDENPTCQKAIADWLQQIREEADKRTDWEVIEKNLPDGKIIYEAIQDAVPRIRHWIETQRLPELKYSLRSSADRIPDLVDKLRRHIPPSEYGVWPTTRAADLRDILTASWFYKLHRLASCEDEKLSDLKAQSVADLLTLKAIESSHVRIVFQNQLAENSA